MCEAIDALACALLEAGVRRAFGVTGSGPSLRLITALDDGGAEYVPVAHEAAAAFMCAGAYRGDGRTAVAITIKGPGVANLIPGIAYAFLEQMPVLSIAESFGPDVPAFRRHKRLPHAALLGPLTKACGSLERIEEVAPRLLALSAAEAPGPVHLDLCLDGIAAPAPSGSPPAEVDVGPLQDRVRRARYPVVIAGALALRRPWGARLQDLRVPVFTTAAAKGLVDERGAWAAGVLTGDGGELAPESSIVGAADLIVGLGLRNVEVLTPRRYGAPLVLIDEADKGLADGFGATLHAVDPTGRVADAALTALSDREWGAELITAARDRLRTALFRDRWSPARCFESLNQLPGEYAVVLDTGSFCTIGEHVWLASVSRPCLGSPNSRFMGASLPVALGYALARPRRPVYCVVGDGGVRPYFAELTIALAEKLPLCVVLMSDGRFGSVASVPQPRAMSRHAVEVALPSWWKAAAALGAEARYADSVDAIERALADWRCEQPLFIEAAFDPEMYAGITAGLR